MSPPADGVRRPLFSEEQLQVLRFAIVHWLNPDADEELANVAVRLEVECQYLALRLRARVAGREVERRPIGWLENPADWWQAFRQRWLPRWWLRRWPVKITRTQITEEVHYRTCPHLKIDPRERHLHFVAWGWPGKESP